MKQLKDWTLQEIKDECEKCYCCGDCEAKKFCDKNIHPLLHPHTWNLEVEECKNTY